MEQNYEAQTFPKTFLSFDPIVLVRDSLRKWALILVAALICGMVAYVYTDTGYVPQYSTQATLVLSTRDSSSTIYSNLDSTATLATVFSEVLNSSVMRNNILDELGMDSFNGSIYASSINSTNLLTVQVVARDPRTAFQVMDVLLKKHEMVTYAVMGDIVLEVLEPPVVPTSPYNAVDSLRAFRNTTVIVAAAVFLLLTAMSYFKDVVRSKEEAEQKLDCWCLGEIHHERKRFRLLDRLRKRKRSILITNPETGFRYVTTMSKLRRRIEQHMHKGKILMVTSVMENEGKSTVSANLALAMARKYERVLLIDLDLRKPACRKIMNQEPPTFWTQDVISGKCTLEQAAKTDKLSRMDMLFARHSKSQDAGDYINSPGLAELLNQARTQYDFVVIDMPPMAAAPDPEAVMEYADGSLLVVRQNAVRATDLNRAIQDLQRGKAKMLGCVLNNVYATGVFSGVGYGHHGGYSRYRRYAAYIKKTEKL